MEQLISKKIEKYGNKYAEMRSQCLVFKNIVDCILGKFEYTCNYQDLTEKISEVL